MNYESSFRSKGFGSKCLWIFLSPYEYEKNALKYTYTFKIYTLNYRVKKLVNIFQKIPKKYFFFV